ncbi:MAG: hypothetical protein GY729_12455 [Desulfobacteraceae bacterium]|nr:hypothetical protein [Desulfobacteraceae bacterium]
MTVVKKKVFSKRSPVDRRSGIDRRIIDIGPQYPSKNRRQKIIGRRKGWEDRYGWERVSKWSSSPVYSDS